MSQTSLDLDHIMDNVNRIILEAGVKVMEIYATDFESYTKEDSSPVTEADLAAEAIITPALQAILPDVPVVAEEAAAAGHIPDIPDGLFWLVDPVDGTKEFLKRNGEFTVNIALIKDREPVLGAVFAPAKETLYWGIVGKAAFKKQGDQAASEMKVRPEQPEGVTIVASRRHGDPEKLSEFLNGRKLHQTINAGSSLKFCLVASGEADMYPRFGPTCEWDTAAGHAVLEAAGGCLTLEDGKTPFTYLKRADFLNPNFVAWGGIR